MGSTIRYWDIVTQTHVFEKPIVENCGASFKNRGIPENLCATLLNSDISKRKVERVHWNRVKERGIEANVCISFSLCLSLSLFLIPLSLTLWFSLPACYFWWQFSFQDSTCISSAEHFLRTWRSLHDRRILAKMSSLSGFQSIGGFRKVLTAEYWISTEQGANIFRLYLVAVQNTKLAQFFFMLLVFWWRINCQKEVRKIILY